MTKFCEDFAASSDADKFELCDTIRTVIRYVEFVPGMVTFGILQQNGFQTSVLYIPFFQELPQDLLRGGRPVAVGTAAWPARHPLQQDLARAEGPRPKARLRRRRGQQGRDSIDI